MSKLLNLSTCSGIGCDTCFRWCFNLAMVLHVFCPFLSLEHRIDDWLQIHNIIVYDFMLYITGCGLHGYSRVFLKIRHFCSCVPKHTISEYPGIL